MRMIRTFVASALALAAIGIASPIGVPGVAAATGSITGTVTGPGGPLAGVTVTAEIIPSAAVEGNFGTAVTSGAGTYSIAGLATGNFRVTFEPLTSSNIIPERYNNVTDFNASPNLVAVVDGAPTANIDATLAQGYTLSGTVTGPDGLPLAGATVNVSDDSDPPLGGGGHFATATTAANGTYTAGPLLPDTYRVEFLAAGMATELYNDKFDTNLDNPQTITAANLTGIDAELEPVTPSAPRTVTGVSGNGQVAVSWVAPFTFGAGGGVLAASGYTATASPGGATCSTGTLSCAITGLTNGTAYTFTVTANNTGSPALPNNPTPPRGVGPASAASAAVTPTGLPGAPTAVTAQAANASATVTWTAPASNGGAAITAYTVTAAPGGATCTTGGTIGCTVTGLTNGTPYTFTVKATNSVGQGPASAASSAVTPQNVESFTALTPGRLLETRSGLSTVDGQFNGVGQRAGGSVTELVVAGRANVPADADGVVLNITVTEPTAAGFIAVYPCGVPIPTTSTVNFVAGQTVANGASVALSGDGKVCLFTNVATQLVVDVTGAYPAGSGFAALTPGRLLETRSGLSTVDGQFNGVGQRAGGSVTELVVAGRANVPSNAEAVVLNITVTEPTAAGFIAVYPCGVPIPTTSTVNFVAGQTVANGASVALSGDGKVCLFTNVATQLVVDVTGAYPAGSGFAALTPGRLLETRSGLSTVDGQFNGVGQRAGGSVTELVVAGRANVPSNAEAVVLNITVTEPTAAGFIAVYPCGVPIPTTSTVNFVAGQTVANGASVALSGDGKVCLFTNVATQLVVDVTGAFAG